MTNPWLDIPLSEYEAHMGADAVRQRPLLDELFGRALDRRHPASVAVLGCSGGAGFEKLVDRRLERVVAVDINARYIEALKARFGAALQTLQTACADAADPKLDLPPIEMVHAALLFEYVTPAAVLANAYRWLVANGTLSVVLQLPVAGKPAVSVTAYRSLEALSPIMRLVAPEELRATAVAAGFVPSLSERIELETGKAFQFLVFERA